MSVFVAERRILRIRPKPLNKVEVLTVIAEEKGADDDINRELVEWELVDGTIRDVMAERWQLLVFRARRLARVRRLFNVMGQWLKEVKRRSNEQ